MFFFSVVLSNKHLAHMLYAFDTIIISFIIKIIYQYINSKNGNAKINKFSSTLADYYWQ